MKRHLPTICFVIFVSLLALALFSSCQSNSQKPIFTPTPLPTSTFTPTPMPTPQPENTPDTLELKKSTSDSGNQMQFLVGSIFYVCFAVLFGYMRGTGFVNTIHFGDIEESEEKKNNLITWILFPIFIYLGLGILICNLFYQVEQIIYKLKNFSREQDNFQPIKWHNSMFVTTIFPIMFFPFILSASSLFIYYFTLSTFIFTKTTIVQFINYVFREIWKLIGQLRLFFIHFFKELFSAIKRMYKKIWQIVRQNYRSLWTTIRKNVRFK